MRHICKPLLNGLRRGSETASIDYFAVFVEGAVMAPGISKIDTNRQLDLRLSARDFYDEVLRRLLHGKQSLPSEDLFIPFISTNPWRSP